MVENVSDTINFYRTIFEFELVSSVPGEGEEYQWGCVEKDGIQLMFQSRKSLSKEIPYFTELPIAASLTFFIKVSGIYELYQRLKVSLEVVSDLHTTTYGMREFAVRDLNGYVIVCAEEVSDSE